MFKRVALHTGAKRPRHVISWDPRYSNDARTTGLLICRLASATRGSMRLLVHSLDQSIDLVAAPRHFGGSQWFFLCPFLRQRASVLWMPPGASCFASRQAWGNQFAYASQFKSPLYRAHSRAHQVSCQTQQGEDQQPDIPPLAPSKTKQTVRKLGLSGFLRGVGDVRIAHGSHRRIWTTVASLLPEAVDDYVEADNSVRFIDVFVDGLDLAAAGFGRRGEATASGLRAGRPAGFYIYGYLGATGSDRADGWSASVAATSRSSGCFGGLMCPATLRRLPTSARQSCGVSRRFPPVRAVALTTRPLRPRVTGGRRNPHQGGQQRPQLHPLCCARSSVQPTSGWEDYSSGSTRAMSRTGRQAAGRAPRTWPRRSQRSARNAAATTMLVQSRANRRGPDLLDTDPDSRAMAARTTKVAVGYNIQVAGRREEQADRRAGGDQPSRGHGPAGR